MVYLAVHKRLMFRSLAVTSAILCFGITAIAASAGSADTRSDARAQGAATAHATFSMY